MFIKDLGCVLPWMENKTTKSCPIVEEKFGQNQMINESLRSKVEKWNAFQNEIKRNKTCPSGYRCNRPIYNIRKEIIKSSVADDNQAIVDIQLESPTVQNVIDLYAYDSQSLIGEIGGTLGLFLGLSTYSLVELITYFMEKFLNCQ